MQLLMEPLWILNNVQIILNNETNKGIIRLKRGVTMFDSILNANRSAITQNLYEFGSVFATEIGNKAYLAADDVAVLANRKYQRSLGQDDNDQNQNSNNNQGVIQQ